jgi:hypothetical protein
VIHLVFSFGFRFFGVERNKYTEEDYFLSRDFVKAVGGSEDCLIYLD